MWTCNVCKTLINKHEKVCTFCGNKIQTLSELLQEKRNEILLLNSSDATELNEIGIKLLNYEIEKFMKFRLGSILIPVLLILCTVLGFYFFNQYESYLDYQNIQKELSNNEYDKVQIHIDEFLSTYGDTPYNSELIRIKDEILYQAENIATQKRTQEYLSHFNKIGEDVSMDGYMVLKLHNSLHALGMDTESIELLDFIQDSDNGSCCVFAYGSHHFAAHYGNDGEISRIVNSLNDEIFSDGKIQIPISDFLLPHEQILDVVRISKMIINLIHDDPTISKFPSMISEKHLWNIMRDDQDNIVILSYVIYVGENNRSILQNFKIVLHEDNNGYKLVDLIFDGEKNCDIVY